MNDTDRLTPVRTIHNLPPQPISLEVLLEKYAKGGESTVDDVHRRVARALAAAEAPERRLDALLERRLEVVVALGRERRLVRRPGLGGLPGRLVNLAGVVERPRAPARERVAGAGDGEREVAQGFGGLPEALVGAARPVGRLGAGRLRQARVREDGLKQADREREQIGRAHV